MTLLALFFSLLVLVATLCLIYLAARLIRPFLPTLVAIGSDPDSLRGQVFPILAFAALVCVMIKLTVF